jgi:3-isopropylmalate dehydrogenase
MSNFSILVLSGDGVGPEVMVEALKILDVVQSSTNTKFTLTHDLCGGCSIDKHGVPVTPEVVALAKKADAVLFGSAGGPKWGTGKIRPEDGLLTLRKELDTFANLRPCKFYSKSLVHLSVLKEESVRGTDFMLSMS